jgi:putative membrane protein
MKQSRNGFQYLLLAVKGMLMGAADAVPGVSGGTIAFISGIYEELIHSLRSFDIAALRLLFTQGPAAAWRHVNGTFLLVLFGGILLSLLSLSRLVLFLLETHAPLLWSFFFGLIVASMWSLCRTVPRWHSSLLVSFATGAVVAYAVTQVTPSALEATPLFVFFSGMIAICAMILPGISGSFILLLLGMYTPIMLAIQGLQFLTLGLFGAGCVVGLLAFSRVLDWAFSHHRTTTLALLGGFMLGSLGKVWPWKYTTAYAINRHGGEVPLVQENVMPGSFEMLTGQDSTLVAALGLMLLGVVLVLLMDRIGRANRP